MFNWLFNIFQKNPPNLTDEQIKKSTRVLIIDDNEPKEIIALLAKEGWKVQWLIDLDALSNKALKSAHIVCLDIMGVGIKLGLENGIGLIKSIKSKYPEKKIILYSTASQQDIFDDSLDLVDKRLKKESTPLPFSAAVEELARKTLNWDDALQLAYSKIAPIMGKDLSYDEFKKTALKSIEKDRINMEKFQQYAKLTASATSIVSSIVKFIIFNNE